MYLVVRAGELVFHPPLFELEAVVDRVISAIVEAAQALPRVYTHQCQLIILSVGVSCRWNMCCFLSWRVQSWSYQVWLWTRNLFLMPEGKL